MANITTQDFSTIVRTIVTAIQGGARTLVDLTVGSILRAVVEANAAVVLWLQGLILQLLATTRAATSNGSDLDTWVADCGLTRLPAVAETGQVSVSRFTATQQAVVPRGARRLRPCRRRVQRERSGCCCEGGRCRERCHRADQYAHAGRPRR